MLVLMTAMVMLIAPSAHVLLQSLVCGVVTLGVLWIKGKRKVAEAARLRGDARSQGELGELLFFHRFELESRVRRARLAATLLGVVIPACFILMRGLLNSTQAWLGFAGVICTIIGGGAYILFVRLPRLRRELAALKGEPTHS